MGGYVVTAPLVIVRDLSGATPGPDLYLYQGATLPDFVSKEQLGNLEGMVAKADAPESAAAKKAAAAKAKADAEADAADAKAAKKTAASSGT